MAGYTSRERVLTAISHREPDRVPLDYWADRIVTERLIKAIVGSDDDRDHGKSGDKEALLERLGIDLRYIEGSIYRGPVLETGEDGARPDIWGVRRRQVPVDAQDPDKGTYEHVVFHPLAGAETVSEVLNYPGWPSPDWYDYSQVEVLAASHDGYAVVCGGDRLNRTSQLKAAMYLRGVEQILLDTVLAPAIVEAVTEKTVEYYLEYNRRVFEQAKGSIDIFFMGDDFGTQQGLFMEIGAWRRFFRKGFRQFIDLAHRYGIRVMHHTCGAITSLIPDFIDCGLDILQSLQPKAAGMDLAAIKREYGAHLAFQGGIDIQDTMPRGTPAQVAAEATERIRTLGPGGGYILCTAHNIQADTPPDNVLALYEAAVNHGWC